MGLAMTKPAPATRRQQRPAKKGPACVKYECRSKNNEGENSVFVIMSDCKNTNDSHRPECKALNRDPRFRQVAAKYQGPIKSSRVYLVKPDPKYECRLGDDYRRAGCQQLLKTVHPGFTRRPGGWQ